MTIQPKIKYSDINIMSKREINLTKPFTTLSKKKIRDFIGAKTTKQLINQAEITLSGTKEQKEKQIFQYYGEIYNETLKEEKKALRKQKQDIKKEQQFRYTGTLTLIKKKENKDGTLRVIQNVSIQVPLLTKDELEQFIKDQEQDGYVIEIKQNIKKVKIQKSKTNIMTSPIKQSGAIEIDGFIRNNVWCKNDGTCVPDYLTYKYSDPKKRFKKYVKNYEVIEKISCFENDQQILFNQPNKNGYTLENIKLFCKNTEMGLYVLHNGKIIIEERRGKYPLVIEVKNNHLYPIENTDLINSISKRNIQSNIVHLGEEKKELKYEEKIFMNEEYDDPILFALKVMKDNNMQVYNNFRIGNNKLFNFKLNNNLIITSQKNELIEKFVNEQGDDYTGQNPIQYLKPFIETLPQSFLNEQVQEALLQTGVKHRTHLGVYNTRNLPLHRPIDKNKFYRSVMENPLDDFMTIDFNSVIMVLDDDYVSKTKINDIEFGLYYVETEDITLLHQSNWYSNKMVQKAIEMKIDMNLKYFIKGTKQSKNILKDIIDKILQMGDYETYKDILKFMINSISGMLGKTETKTTELYVDTDLNRVWENYFKLKGTDKLIYREYKDLYAYGKEKSVLNLSNNIPMYIQILDWSNIILNNLILELGGYEFLHYRKTDCIQMYNIGQKLKVSKEVGGYDYEEDIKDYKEMNVNRSVFYKPNQQPIKKIANIQNSDDYQKIINMLVKGESLMLEARAGTGKSFCIKQIEDYFNKKDLMVQKIAFTNKASNNIKGQTIHKLLCMDSNGVSNQKQLEKKMKNTAVICIDEISMINKDLWKQIYQLKKKYPKVPFLLSGDPRQLPPVEEEIIDYFNHPTIYYICDFNVAELKFFEKCRYDKKLYDYLEKISLGQPLDMYIPINHFDVSKKGHNICYSNKKRKEVNKLFNEDYKDTKQNKFIDYDDKEDQYNQPFYIYEGLPIIANKTINKEGIMKNETFTIKNINFDKETFTIDLEDKQFNFNDIHKVFTICYCMTTHKSQGDTIEGNVNIHEYNWISQDKKIFYTAVSRAKSFDNVKYYY
jgi:hypothetical protein